MTVRPLCFAIAAALLSALPCPSLAWAANGDHGDQREHHHGHPDDHRSHGEHERELDEVVVTASPLRQRPDEVAMPVEVLSGTELDDRRAATLGESVARLPGVHSSAFGAGVGRPIIRGLDGARVQVLGEGLSTLDVSTVSVDHAVTLDPFLADQIEVLKGPATLLFGSGAVGGAVNVVDGRIHERPMQGMHGRAELRGNDVADERAGAARIDAGNGRFVLHADVFHRDTGDYAIPGFAVLDGRDDHDHDHAHAGHGDDDDGHDHDEPAHGVLPNSATRTRGGALGFSHATARGFAGVAVSRYESRYGVPAHAHHDDDHDPHGHGRGRAGDDGGGDDHGHPHEHADVRIDMRQTRIDAKAGLNGPFAGHDALRLRLGHSNYTHTEMEGDAVGTVFDSDGYEGRVELVHAPVAGWRGAYGVQFSRRDFTAVGAEAFVPPSVSDDIGVFVLERRHWDRFNLQLGARFDRVEVEPEAALPARRFNAFSASLAGEWRFAEHWHLSLGIDRAQRAPTAEELYSDGLHVATSSYEIGDSALEKETANQFELGLHYHSDWLELKLAAWRNRFDRFTYLRYDDDGHGNVDLSRGQDDEGEPVVPLLHWHQHDATFRGAEMEAKITLAEPDSGRYQLRLMADRVRGDLDHGGHLPRIAPDRFGAGLDWSRGAWRAGVSALRHRSQDRVAEQETPTSGYTVIDADLAYSFAWNEREIELFVQGRNLGDEEIRVHTSFLKDLAPQPGRSMAAGIRAWF